MVAELRETKSETSCQQGEYIMRDYFSIYISTNFLKYMYRISVTVFLIFPIFVTFRTISTICFNKFHAKYYKIFTIKLLKSTIVENSFLVPNWHAQYQPHDSLYFFVFCVLCFFLWGCRKLNYFLFNSSRDNALYLYRFVYKRSDPKWAWIAYSIHRFATGWKVRGQNRGVGEIFYTRALFHQLPR